MIAKENTKNTQMAARKVKLAKALKANIKRRKVAIPDSAKGDKAS